MRNTLVLLALLVIVLAGGCATVQKGFCDLDNFIKACPTEATPKGNDVLPGNGS